MTRNLHYRAFAITVGWTLGLLFLGSVVHATESSLACPDWPTCFGTMMPEMSGGVFWEHLHRLVAGGLLLLWGAGTWYVFREGTATWMKVAAVAGVVLLLTQSVLGGLTVIYQLPDAVSTSHLSMAFLFLSLATVLAVRSAPGRDRRNRIERGPARRIGLLAGGAATLVFLQSVVGAAVRHTDSGMACPDVPLCLGEWVPPLANGLIALQFAHRLLGVVVGLVVLWLTWETFRLPMTRTLRRLGVLATVLVLGQITLGILSVTTFLAVIPVSLHTLGAALLLTTTVAMAALCREQLAERGAEVDGEDPAARRSTPSGVGDAPAGVGL